MATGKLRPSLGHVASSREGHHDGDGILDLGEASFLFLAFLEPHIRLAVGNSRKNLLELFLEPLENLIGEDLLLFFAVLNQTLHLGFSLLDFLEGPPLFGEFLPVDINFREEYLLSGGVVVLRLLVVGHVAETHAERVGFFLDFLDSEVHIADFLQFFVVISDLFGEQGNVADRFIVLELLGGDLLLELEDLSFELLHSILPFLQLVLKLLLVFLLPDVLDVKVFVELQFSLDLCDFFVELLLLSC